LSARKDKEVLIYCATENENKGEELAQTKGKIRIKFTPLEYEFL